MPMRILYIGTPYSVHDIKWAGFFSAQKDFQVFFIGEKQNIPIGVTELEVREHYQKLNITYLGSLSTFSISHPLATITSIFQLQHLIKEHKIDLVHILFAAPFALWGLFISCKYLITTRGSDILVVIPELKNHSGFKGFYFKLLYRLFTKSFQKANAVTSTSGRQAEKAKELMDIKEPVVIRTGVDVEKIDLTRGNDLIELELKGSKFIFSPRDMKPVYNLELQTDAIGLLNENILKSYRFVFLKGLSYDKKYFADIQARLEKLKREKGLKYIMLDKLNQQQMAQYYKNASLTIMTPLSDGTPNTALEAMAAHCPLIVPNLPYDDALFNGTCIKLKSEDANDLATAITTALGNYPKEVIDKAFEAVNQFGNRKTEMQKLHDIYLKLNS
jgi:glycosyltransferase involved in cell wall biosynthesis